MDNEVIGFLSLFLRKSMTGILKMWGLCPESLTPIDLYSET